MFNHITQLTLWLFCCISLCIFTFGISWKIAISFNFGYQQIYPAIAIDKTIEKFAPLNRYNKRDFVDTDTLQHISLFEDIVTSISHSGSGLAEITYKNKKNEDRVLLTKAEIVHLNDVSILVDNLGVIWLVNNIFLLVFIYYFSINNSKNLNRSKKWFVLMMILLLILGLSLLGFTRIFYYLHTVVFPDNHQWFFYYQESLMTTLMKAPDIFVVIASLIVLIALPIYIIGYNLIFSKKYNVINLMKS